MWKHFIFTDFLSNLSSESLKIIDTHGGDGFYPLHYGASWKRGYGLIGADDLNKYELLSHPYFAIESSYFNQKKIYLGFWPLCAEIMKTGCDWDFDVCEIQKEVFDDALKFSKKFNVSARVNLQNKSYHEQNFEEYDIAFVDPTYRRKDDQGDDWKKVVDLCNTLSKKNCDYMVWYPVYDKRISFKLWQQLDCYSLEARWFANETFKFASSGSGILISKGLYEKIQPDIELYKRVASLLNAEMQLHKNS